MTMKTQTMSKTCNKNESKFHPHPRARDPITGELLISDTEKERKEALAANRRFNDICFKCFVWQPKTFNSYY